jgi:hypothetical protein
VKAHGGIVLRIRNDGPATAKSVVLTVRRKDFPAKGEDAPTLAYGADRCRGLRARVLLPGEQVSKEIAARRAEAPWRGLQDVA